MMMAELQINQDLKVEARRVLAAMDERGLKVRILGGVGIAIALGDRINPAFAREFGDIDLITTKRDGSAVEKTIEGLGWDPARQFNAINGARRFLFEDPTSGRKIDVFVGRFEMCHQLPLTDRLKVRSETLSPADLLLTKMQIVELNAKDRGDCYALLLGFPAVDHDDPEVLDIGRISRLTAADWGLHHTFELNIARLREGLAEAGLSDSERSTVNEALDSIQSAMELESKSRAWKMRARIGERKRWYEEPAEIG